MALSRTFGIIAVAGVSLLPFASSLDTLLFADEPAKQQQQEDDTPLPTDIEIEKLMQRKTVDAILEEELIKGMIHRIDYYSEGIKRGYIEEIFQHSVPSQERKPRVVLVHPGEFKRITNPEVHKRSAIVFKILVDKYALRSVPDVEFCVYDFNKDPEFNPKSKEEEKAYLRRFGLTGLPSIVLYSSFDLVKGETPTNNDGEIKQIDVVNGGPSADNWIIPWLLPTDNCCGLFNWVNSNLKSNNSFCWRFYNSGSYSYNKVFYNPSEKSNEK